MHIAFFLQQSYDTFDHCRMGNDCPLHFRFSYQIWFQQNLFFFFQETFPIPLVKLFPFSVCYKPVLPHKLSQERITTSLFILFVLLYMYSICFLSTVPVSGCPVFTCCFRHHVYHILSHQISPILRSRYSQNVSVNPLKNVVNITMLDASTPSCPIFLAMT